MIFQMLKLFINIRILKFILTYKLKYNSKTERITVMYLVFLSE